MEGIGNVIRKSGVTAARKPKPGQGALPGLEAYAPRPKEKHLHSEAHALAGEMCRYFAEALSGPNSKFGTYLGVIKRLGTARARALFADFKADLKDGARNPRKLFMWLTSERASTPPESGRKITS